MELSERCIKALERDGFPHIYEWSDTPGTIYETHSHKDKVTLFVTEGNITITLAGLAQTYRAGDRINIPPGLPHSAVVGEAGCQLVVGEMIAGDS